MNERIPFDEYFMDIAFLSARRGTCVRRSVGCVLVDSTNHVISTGYNGNPSKHLHCIDFPCPGATAASGTKLDACEAIHAEINALIHCRCIDAISKIYTTTSPCVSCTKALLASPCTEIIFAEEYPHSESKTLWLKSGRIWRQYERNQTK